MIRWLPIVLCACGWGRPDALTSVVYEAVWNTSGVVQGEAGWSVVNDLGYRFEVEEGWLIEHSATLVPCASRSALGWAPVLMSWTSPVAYAAHAVVADPSLVEPQRAVDLRTLTASPLGERRLEGGDYCRVYWMVGRALRGSVDDQQRPVGATSLHLAGRWSKGDVQGRFDLTTDWTQGRHYPLSDARGSGPHLSVRVERDAASLWTAVDPQVHTDLEVAWQVLLNLTEHTKVSLVRAEGAP